MKGRIVFPLLLTLLGGSTLAVRSQTCECGGHGPVTSGLCTADSGTLSTGTYWRPPREEITGDSTSDKPYKRSPCPALNALANHGILPRSGAGLTISMVADKLLEAYNLDWKIGAGLALVSKVWLYIPPWKTFTLADLGNHNVIEHDASLFHYDAYFKHDPSEVDKDAVEQLISLSKDGKIVDIEDLIRFREMRTKASVDNNPDFRMGVLQKRILAGESALLLTLLGRNESISVEHLKSFVLEEKIPGGYKRPNEVYTVSDMKPTQYRVLHEDKVLAGV